MSSTRRKVYEPNNAELREEAMARLRSLFPRPAIATDVTEVPTMVTHVSRSGMSRVIAVFAVREGKVSNVSYDVARVMGWQHDSEHRGVYIGGCGMDMAFHVVYSLSRMLYGDDPSIGGPDAGYILTKVSL